MPDNDGIIIKLTVDKTTKKIVIIGPESTGKSTLTEALSKHYGSPFIPEFAREYLNSLNRPYEHKDLLAIARGQINSENEKVATTHNGYLFCDTDLYVLKVWSEHKYGLCDEWILRQIALRYYDYYFLTDIDLPWQPDPQREHPEPEMRDYFFRLYKDIVVHSGTPWKLLSGDEHQRLTMAIEAIDSHFHKP